jgi:putative tryptophan/tyrosine transport system substrate-binding protein
MAENVTITFTLVETSSRMISGKRDVGGGLIAYGVEIAHLSRRAVQYIDRILKGANPASLPVQRPTKFELVINLKTAKTLGLAIPSLLVLQADHSIE